MPFLQRLAPSVLDRAPDARTIRTASPRGLRSAATTRPCSDARTETWSPDAIVRLARIATIRQVVDHAARLPPSARLPHVAFVGDLAYGRIDLDARVGRRFVERAYQATTQTAKRIASDLSRSLVWEAWEGRCLLRACAVLSGRLRAVVTTESFDEEWPASSS